MSKAVEPASSESPTLLSLSSTSPSDWSYLSEGGANVILSYNGPYLSPFFSKVIRVRKRAGGVAIVGGEAELFRTRVVPQLLGEQFLLRAQVVEVGREWLDGLESSLRDGRKRESSRENDEGGDWDQRVELLDDLVTGKGVLSVEIKPKWLFLPPSSASRSIKEQHCRYCMHTYLRNDRDHNASIARERHDEGYCPLDLASGVPSRIERSINGLWKAWVNSNGQNNNLRLFLNGSVIQPGVAADLKRLDAHLSNAGPLPETRRSSLLASLLVPSISTSPLFPTVKRLQSLLVPHDYESLLALPLSPSDVDPEPTTIELEDRLAYWTTPSDSRPPRSSRDLVLDALISATFKDCSIFLRFEPGRSEPTLKVVDLDLKSIRKLKKWGELDKEIWENFARMLEVEGGGGQVRTCYAA